VAPRKRQTKKDTDPLAAYRRIRKPMPPPERVLPDKRRREQEREARRQAEREALEEDG